MKKRDFSSLVGAEAIRLSEGHFNLVVESLDNPAGNGLFGSEAIEQNLPMLGEAGRDGLELFETRASDSLAPAIQELARPGGRDIAPKVVKGGHQPKSADGGQARMLQLSHAPAFAGGPILPVLEQRPPKLLQARHQSGLGQRPRFVTADLIDRFIELPANVEAVPD